MTAVDQALAELQDDHDPREALRVAIIAHAEAVLEVVTTQERTFEHLVNSHPTHASTDKVTELRQIWTRLSMTGLNRERRGDSTVQSPASSLSARCVGRSSG